MNLKPFAMSLLALSLCSAGAMKIKAQEAPPPPPPPGYAQLSYSQDRDWDRAPDEYRDAQRHGFHEGVEAARRDFADRRHADADDHEVYKHPPVEGGEARRDFREGFKEGYHRAMDHMRHDRDDQPHF